MGGAGGVAGVRATARDGICHRVVGGQASDGQSGETALKKCTHAEPNDFD